MGTYKNCFFHFEDIKKRSLTFKVPQSPVSIKTFNGYGTIKVFGSFLLQLGHNIRGEATFKGYRDQIESGYPAIGKFIDKMIHTNFKIRCGWPPYQRKS
jgi:hypothetical protein